MKEKCEVSKFREGDTKEHEGITYVAVRQKKKKKRNLRAVRVPQVRRTVQKP